MSYRAGIIGAGGIAGLGILGTHDEEDIGQKKFRASHAGGYESSDDIELVAVADVEREKLDRFGNAWDIPSDRQYRGHENMLAQEDLDVVSVCSPTFLHHQHVIDAAQSAANPDVIWCEKPIAASVADANEMVAVCEDTDTELVINHSLRFTHKIQKLKALLDDGLIGTIKSVNAQFRRELLRNSTHLLDTLVYLLDARATRVSGYINGQNDAVDALKGDRDVADSGGGGFVITENDTFVTVDCTVARDISSMSFQLIGTEGKLYLNNDDGEWRYWTLDGSTHREQPIPGIENAWSWDDDYKEAFSVAANHLKELLAGEASNHSTGEDATRSLEIIVGFYLSHYTDGTVEVPLESPLRDITITSW